MRNALRWNAIFFLTSTRTIPFPRLSVFQQLIFFDLFAMTGSTSGGAKTAHLRLESGGKGGWVAKEEIVNYVLYDERMSMGVFLL